MEKRFKILISIVIFIAFLLGLTKFTGDGFKFFAVGLFLLTLAPYSVLVTLSLFFRVFWISLFTSILMLALDIYVHAMVFIWPQDAQDAIGLIFSPFIILGICLFSFIILGAIHIIFIKKGINLPEFFDKLFSPIGLKNLLIPGGISLFIWFFGLFLLNADFLFESPLHKAITMGDIEKAKTLVDKGADLNALNNQEETPLESAVATNHAEMTEYLIKHGAKFDFINKRHDMSPLMWAAWTGTEKSGAALIKAGANIEMKNSGGYTALHQAADWNQPGMVKLLIKAGADINSKTERGQTPLQLACMKGDIKSVSILHNIKHLYLY